MERSHIRRWQLPRISGEFRMLLPAQQNAAKNDAMLLGRGLQRLAIATGAEIGKGSAVAFGGIAGGVEGKMQDAAWRLERREGSGVHLTKNSCTQRMGLKTRSTLFSH